MKTSNKSDELKNLWKKKGEGPQIGYLWLWHYRQNTKISKWIVFNSEENVVKTIPNGSLCACNL